MKVIKFLLITAIVIMLAACGSNKAQAPQVVEKTPLDLAIETSYSAQSSFENEEYSEAITKYNQAIVYYNQALPTSTAPDSINKEIFNIRRNIANIHTISALDYSAQNDFDSALENYETAINLYKELQPQSAPQDSLEHIIVTLYRNAAVVSRQAGEYEKALNYYDLYLEANPDEDDILLQKFAIYRDDLRNETQAFEVLKEYAVSKNDFNAYHRLGDLYRDKNDFQNAIIWYERANSVKTDANVLQKLGSIYRNPQIQQWDKSTQALERFVSTNPGLDALSTAYKLIGDNYKNLKNRAKAVEYFERYIDLEYDESIALYICLYYYDMKNDAKTLSWANIVLQNNPNNSTALLFRGIAKYNQKDMRGAKADFESIQNDPQHGKTAQQYLKIIK
ncbi:MAG: tetratricopeptide repeat protein [Candidatus Cloacimonadaceae bacterium]